MMCRWNQMYLELKNKIDNKHQQKLESSQNN